MSDQAAATSQAGPAWMSALPAELQGNPTLSSFKGDKIEDVLPVIAKSYVEARGLIGQREKKEDELFPKDDWKPEQYAAFNKRIGVPESPDKYPQIDPELAAKAGIPKEILDAALKKAHELSLTPRQTSGLINEWYVKTAVTGAEMQAKAKAEAHQKTISDLQQEFGDKFDAKKGLVRSVLQHGGQDLVESIEAGGYGDDPRMFRALAQLGEKLLEDRSAGGRSSVDLGPEAAAAAAQKRIEEIKAARIADPNLEVKYSDPRSAEYNEWRELFKKGYPG